MSRIPKKSEIYDLMMAAKLWRDFKIMSGIWQDIQLFHWNKCIARTAYQVKKCLMTYCYRVANLWVNRSDILWEHDEWYWKRVFEREISSWNRSYKWEDQVDAYAILESVNFNSNLFRDERTPHRDAKNEEIYRIAKDYRGEGDLESEVVG